MSTLSVSSLNRELNRIPKRAEQQQAERLRDTFVDSGVAIALETIDHQILYGRRGTGKTHAFRYLESVVTEAGDIAIYLDLRTLGSPDGIFMGEEMPATQRAGRLLVDLLNAVYEQILTVIVENDELVSSGHIVGRLDALLASIATVVVSGPVEREEEDEQVSSEKSSSSLGVRLSSQPSLTVGASDEESGESRTRSRTSRRGEERISLNFGDVARALRELADAFTVKRFWLLLDEWISVPPEIQPMLGEFLVRCVLPLQMFTVKIAAIEQQSRFRTTLEDGRQIGIELGADVTANLDLDNFMVFEENEEVARSFFLGLLVKHLKLSDSDASKIEGLNRDTDLIKLGFTDKRAFDELLRAGEGVPRDVINIVGHAAITAGAKKISVPDIRKAAQKWYESDKEAAVRARPDASLLLNWIIDEVIRQKRARGFMVSQRDADDPLLLALFDARVLHVVRRGYSAKDEPGERYDVYVIDYGAYVDLINTSSSPQGILALGDDDAPEWGDVPKEDLRALRRAILDLTAFRLDTETPGAVQF
jgi:hypothetical protein